MPNGFIIYAILIKNLNDVQSSETAFFKELETQGLWYVRRAKSESDNAANGVSEWVGSSLKNLITALINQHKGNTQAWIFDSDDATCKSPSDLAGRKLSTMDLSKKRKVNPNAGFSTKKKGLP